MRKRHTIKLELSEGKALLIANELTESAKNRSEALQELLCTADPEDAQAAILALASLQKRIDSCNQIAQEILDEVLKNG